MSDLHISPLDAPLWPLLNKFYRAHGSKMRAPAKGFSWVAKREAIIGALNLTPVAEGYWLTGLFVDPACRGQKIAARLLLQAVESLDGPVWLFCHPDLQGFYQNLGFVADPPLPQVLAERLARYQRDKAMVAMGL